MNGLSLTAVSVYQLWLSEGNTGTIGDMFASFQYQTKVYTQIDRPTQDGPWMWWVMDAGGNIINLIVNDGV